ncbi:MAG: sigma-70 family RNA polymerase sigma factor [Firmicutes bacterium]|jgi:RNA polymerase sigma-70 factor (ECF subfamily)|nr:sigma-70 family RNA polymerase sigma factor [Bacillota bacterium]
MSALQQEAERSLQWFDNLYRQNAAHVYQIALFMLRDPVEAEDLCHDVFLEVIQRPEQFDPGRGSVKAWLAVKTRSRAIDRLRRLKREEACAVVKFPLAGETDPTTEKVITKLEIESLHESLQHLPGPQRAAVTATYFHALPQKDWARLTGRPLGTVKSWIRYGLNNLRKQFVHMGWLEP